MSPSTQGIIVLVTTVLVLLTGAPVAFALGAVGVVFLALFQVFVLLYTGYIAFTNYGTGHVGSKEQAVSSLMAASLERVPDSPTYKVTVVDQLGTLGLLVTDPDGTPLELVRRTD